MQIPKLRFCTVAEDQTSSAPEAGEWRSQIAQIGQQLWLQHLETFEQLLLLQAPQTRNLDQVVPLAGHVSD